MIFSNSLTYYEILEIKPDASAQEIRQAYQKLRESYKGDNVALYSLMDPSESEEMLSRIEEAFSILSDPDLRKDYDQRLGYTHTIDDKISTFDALFSDNDDTLLVSPPTDFEVGSATATASQTSVRHDRPPSESQGLASGTDPIEELIFSENEYSGTFLKKMRELRRLSLEDLSAYTRISKMYLIALEEEAFNRLPAPVFIRGFVIQVAKALKLPHEKAAQAYMGRVRRKNLS